MSVTVLPRPAFLDELGGSVSWRSPLRVRLDVEEWRGVVETFAEDLARSVGWSVDFVGEADEADIEVRKLPELTGEQYQLAVARTTSLEAGNPAGLSYALTTLRQLGPVALWSEAKVELDEATLPCVVIQDGPRFVWRGVHLDVSRHFFGLDVILRLIDQMSAHRLNRLHLHLNDDQGWRVEIPGWPRLTSIGATRSSSPIGHERESLDDGVAHGGFYSAADVGVLLRHAERRSVQIVPEIDLPGHAQAVLAAYPELGNTDDHLEVWTRWGISEHVLNVGNVALDFAADVVGRVADLFAGSPVHIGGDECPTKEWEQSERARAVMDEFGFRDVRQLQGLYTQRMAAVLSDRGRETIAWDEVLDAEVPEGTVIAAWRSVDQGVEAARRGHEVVMAPMQYLYFDWLNSDAPAEPVALAPAPHVTTWERVYGYEVVPDSLIGEERSLIRGAQAQLWSEYIATRDHLDYMAFPRLCAFSEVVWGTTTDIEDFRPRLVDHLTRLDAMGVRYRPLDAS
ncbi:MAG TPA: beta-N-acetylhexosaminidase [Acidimicrobiales bacterium]